MPIRKHDPVPEEVMEQQSPYNTICETLRGIYHKVTDPDIKLDLRIATSMAKSITAKLAEYRKSDNFSDIWAINDKFTEYDDILKNLDKSPFAGEPIDVLLLTYDDNANTGYRFWRCLKSLGLNAIMFKAISHPFGYPRQAPVHNGFGKTLLNTIPLTVYGGGLEEIINSAKVVHFIASTYVISNVDYTKKNIVVQHGGSTYRQYPEKVNHVFNQIADATIIQCPDLLGLGAKNEQLIYYPVDTEGIQPDYNRHDGKIIIGHFPSNPEVKGTGTILEVIKKLKESHGDKFKYIGLRHQDLHRNIPWHQNLARYKYCDVIIETCKPTQNNKPYGEWGNTAIEAAASGCIVISNTFSHDRYEKEYKSALGIKIANNKENLEQQLINIFNMKDEEILNEKRLARHWAHSNHGMEATAKRLWDKVYKNFF